MTNISERRLLFLFMDGLTKPLKGWVKGFNPNTLIVLIKKARDMVISTYSSKSYSHTELLLAPKEKDSKLPPKKQSMNEATRQDLRRKLCFNCKESWEPGHDA